MKLFQVISESPFLSGITFFVIALMWIYTFKADKQKL